MSGAETARQRWAATFLLHPLPADRHLHDGANRIGLAYEQYGITSVTVSQRLPPRCEQPKEPPTQQKAGPPGLEFPLFRPHLAQIGSPMS